MQQVDTTCKTSERVFGWVKLQVNMLQKLSCLVISGYLFGYGYKVCSSGSCVCLLSAARWYYLPTPPLGQDMTQGQFLSGV